MIWIIFCESYEHRFSARKIRDPKKECVLVNIIIHPLDYNAIQRSESTREKHFAVKGQTGDSSAGM